MEMAHAHNWLTVSGTDQAVVYGVGSMPGDPWGDLVFGLLQARFAREVRDQLTRGGHIPLVETRGTGVFPDPSSPPTLAPIPEVSFIDDMANPFDADSAPQLVQRARDIVAVIDPISV
eukprot:2904593-Alexandrium_andersonii.AAC.1